MTEGGIGWKGGRTGGRDAGGNRKRWLEETEEGKMEEGREAGIVGRTDGRKVCEITITRKCWRND